MRKFIATFLLGFYASFGIAQQNNTGFLLVEKPLAKQMEVRYNGKLLTAYCFYDSVMKPVLFPINTLDGITITRGYPLLPAAGERVDHPHHVGMWMNYESVNGLDFWNNSTAIPFDKRNLYGTIRHQQISNKKITTSTASFTATASWLRPDGHILLNEKTIFTFSIVRNELCIDRFCTLTANDTAVLFKDAKDGLLAIRVARELEMPSAQGDIFVDAQGNQTKLDKINNDAITGMYTGSTGLKGDSVWSSKGTWVMLTGKKQGKEITIAMIDHPENPGYPTYWHARGYGLFAANPLGRKIFSNGKEVLNFLLQPHRSTTFRYRVIIAAGKKLTATEIDQHAKAFAIKYK